MKADIQARGFALTESLRQAVENEAAYYARHFPALMPRLEVRLFDANGTARGGVDHGCLVCARVGRWKRTVVASAIDADMYRAIVAAFARLTRSTRATSDRRTNARRGRSRLPDVKAGLAPGH